MTNPITWQNVQGNSPAQAVAPLDFARQSFKDAFSGLGDVLKQREATDASNAVQSRENATQDMLGEMRAPSTVEDFNAKKADFAARLKEAGAGVNRGMLGNFLESQGAVLQNRATTDRTFNDAQITAEQRDRVDHAKLLFANGKTDEGNAYLAANQDLRNLGELTQFGVTNHRGFTAEERAATASEQAKLTAQAQIQNWKDSTKIAQGNLDVNVANSDSQGRVAAITEAERFDKMIAAKREQIAVLGDSPNTPEGFARISADIKASIKDDRNKGIAENALPKLMAIPGITTNVITSVLRGIKPTKWWDNDNAIIDGAVKDAHAALADGNSVLSRGTADKQSKTLQKELGDLIRSKESNAADNADDPEAAHKVLDARAAAAKLEADKAAAAKVVADKVTADKGNTDKTPAVVNPLNLPVPLAKDYVGESDATKLSNFARNSVKQFGDWNTSFNDKLEQGMLRQKINSNSELTPLERRNAIKAGLLQVKPTPIKY